MLTMRLPYTGTPPLVSHVDDAPTGTPPFVSHVDDAPTTYGYTSSAPLVSHVDDTSTGTPPLVSHVDDALATPRSRVHAVARAGCGRRGPHHRLPLQADVPPAPVRHRRPLRGARPTRGGVGEGQGAFESTWEGQGAARRRPSSASST
eukprot:1188172-Prorocentrum_minimum.AAC.3